MRLFCPDCRMPVWVSGGALIVVGFLWGLVSHGALIVACFLWGLIGRSVDPVLIGMGGAISFITIGVCRLVKQFRARRRNPSGAANQPLQRDG